MVALALMVFSVGATADGFRVRLTVTSELELANVPMDPKIDFGELIAEAGAAGALDPNSIEVIDLATGETVPHARSEDFAYGDSGRVEWVIPAPDHTRYEIRFSTRDTRPALKPQAYTPAIGVGDLLRYNAGEPRPVALIYPGGLHDMTGDGKLDLVGCWNYAYRPGWPWDGVVCYPRNSGNGRLRVGDMVRLRYRDADGNLQYFRHTYMTAGFGDVNGDGLVDVVHSKNRGDQVDIYLNSGDRDAGGMPIFESGGSAKRPEGAWSPCRVTDLNGDGVADIVVGGAYIRSASETAVTLDAGLDACFYDIDADGRPDAVCLVDGEDDPRNRGIAWRRNLGGDPPTFAEEEPIEGVDEFWCASVAATPGGLLIGHDVWQRVSHYRQVRPGEPRFRKVGQAESISAVMALSDQAWPCLCDWDGDGDLDMLVGGGYGWPRIVINEGSREKPAFAEARQIEADGKPIRLLRDEVLGSDHWHNMGYPYPGYVDWDGDGLPDLILPNETNRIFWYKNVGTRSRPRFGERSQIVVDGYPDSPEARATSAKLAGDKSVPNNPYPYEENQPFFWRTGCGFADLTGDGLMDLITHDGHVRKLMLFEQYRADDGRFRLRRRGPLKLQDGRLIDDAVVDRSAHWTESFRCVDWDADGLTDVVYSCAGTDAAKGSIYLLRNVGTATDPVFAAPRTLRCFGEPIKVTSHGPHPWVGDFDGDAQPDVVTCVEWSVYPYYRHAAIDMEERPRWRLGRVEAR